MDKKFYIALGVMALLIVGAAAYVGPTSQVDMPDVHVYAKTENSSSNTSLDNSDDNSIKQDLGVGKRTLGLVTLEGPRFPLEVENYQGFYQGCNPLPCTPSDKINAYNDKGEKIGQLYTYMNDNYFSSWDIMGPLQNPPNVDLSIQEMPIRLVLNDGDYMDMIIRKLYGYSSSEPSPNGEPNYIGMTNYFGEILGGTGKLRDAEGTFYAYDKSDIGLVSVPGFPEPIYVPTFMINGAFVVDIQ